MAGHLKWRKHKCHVPRPRPAPMNERSHICRVVRLRWAGHHRSCPGRGSIHAVYEHESTTNCAAYRRRYNGFLSHSICISQSDIREPVSPHPEGAPGINCRLTNEAQPSLIPKGTVVGSVERAVKGGLLEHQAPVVHFL
jgi:hypothetical protein